MQHGSIMTTQTTDTFDLQPKVDPINIFYSNLFFSIVWQCSAITACLVPWYRPSVVHPGRSTDGVTRCRLVIRSKRRSPPRLPLLRSRISFRFTSSSITRRSSRESTSCLVSAQTRSISRFVSADCFVFRPSLREFVSCASLYPLPLNCIV